MARTRHVAVVARLFHVYDREILRGIAAYVREHGQWSLYVEEDMPQKMPDLGSWNGDGLIVNFDDPGAARAVRGLGLPVVGFGGGRGWYNPHSGIPYFETDDEKIAQLAAEHLLERGLRNFAFCGYPPTRTNVWAANRARGFVERLAREGCTCHVYKGRYTTARRWERLQQELVSWLAPLPKPLGLMACYDSRARHVLEACRTLGLRVPDDVAVIGVDNDPITCELARPPLSSVEQGCFRVGYGAAELLDRMMAGEKPDRLRYRVAPVGVVGRQSTDLLAVADPDVAAAMRLIREKACEGMTADEIAAELNWSRSTLDNRFKATIGGTTHQQIQHARLGRAKMLLSQTELPLKVVAARSGYANEQYLTAVVRKHTGRTPGQYRRDTRRGNGGALLEGDANGLT